MSPDAGVAALGTGWTTTPDAATRRKVLTERLQAPIYFTYEGYDLTADARALLEEKLEIIRANPELRIRITAYADRRGPADYNRVLSRRRAAAARRYFVQRGVDAGRISIRGAGEDWAGMTNAVADSRRADFAVARQRR